jgi:predicted transcriptional regulator
MAQLQRKQVQATIYFSREMQPLGLVERLEKIAKREDRTINYLVVKAILQFLEREERKSI